MDFVGFCWYGLLKEDGFEEGGLFGELSEDIRAVKITAGAIAGIAIE